MGGPTVVEGGAPWLSYQQPGAPLRFRFLHEPASVLWFIDPSEAVLRVGLMRQIGGACNPF